MRFVAEGRTEVENCWQFVQYVLSEEYGHIIPDFKASDEIELVIKEKIRQRELMDCWDEVSAPRSGDIAVFILQGIRPHIAIMLDSVRLLHFKNRHVGVAIESLDNHNWRHKLEGLYRNNQLTSLY